MKLALFAGGLFALLAGVAVFFTVESRNRAQAELAAAQRAAAEARAAATQVATPAPSDAARIDALERELDSVSMQLSQLSADLAALRGASERTPAVAATADEKVAEAAALATNRALSESEREDVREVLAQEFKRQEAEREAQRQKREQEAAERRADSIAKKLSLSAKDASRLSEILVAENQKRRELFEGFQDAGFDREQMRQTMGELQTWKKDELTAAFGAGLADQISELDQPRRGGFGGDFGGPGGGFGGGGRRGGGANNNGGND
ncbi:MAG: hypothetical protein L6Q99_11700 [Planctomycetes bacterium]|nr:hypothetical protein [Planctomycetota bacterium]